MTMEIILEAVKTLGFPIVMGVVLLVAFIRANETHGKQQEKQFNMLMDFIRSNGKELREQTTLLARIESALNLRRERAHKPGEGEEKP